MERIVVKNLRKKFGNKEVLKGISFKVYEGEIFGLLGHNGAGKTTTLRILANIIEDYDGEVILNGSVGYLPEERGLYQEEKVKDVIYYFGELANLDKDTIKNNMEYYLKELNITEYKDYLIKKLSKGNQQKIQFICSIIHEPDIIILDEPFSGLDVVNLNLFKKMIYRFKKMGKSIILSTHQLEKIERFCDRIMILKNGEMVHYGRLDEICSVKNAYIEYLKDGNLIKKTLPYEEGINLLKNEDILNNLIKFEVRGSLEDLFIKEYES